MKLVSILKGSTVKAAKPSAPFGYLPEVIAAVAERYKFAEIPTDISKLIPHGDAQAESPATFRHGKVDIGDRSLLIEELQVFQNGTVVSMPSSTTDSDLVTEDIFRWASERFKLDFQPIRPLVHASQLEIQFARPLPDLFSPLKEIGVAIEKGLDPLWESLPSYELINIQFGMDPTKAPKLNPGMFRIERRTEMPFELGLYFCEAAMTTDNHLTILARFERICLEKIAKE
jgi:hypothetical protein